MKSGKLTEGEWCIYASVYENNIGSDNGLSPVCHQAIIWTIFFLAHYQLHHMEHISIKFYLTFESYH